MMTDDVHFFWVLYYLAHTLSQINLAFPTDIVTNVSQDRDCSLLTI